MSTEINETLLKFVKSNPQPYQVMRNTKSDHIISDGLSMTITTFVRVENGKHRDNHVSVTFTVETQSSKKDTVAVLSSGDTYDLLKEKYFKQEMVSF